MMDPVKYCVRLAKENFCTGETLQRNSTMPASLPLLRKSSSSSPQRGGGGSWKPDFDCRPMSLAEGRTAGRMRDRVLKAHSHSPDPGICHLPRFPVQRLQNTRTPLTQSLCTCSFTWKQTVSKALEHRSKYCVPRGPVGLMFSTSRGRVLLIAQSQTAQQCDYTQNYRWQRLGTKPCSQGSSSCLLMYRLLKLAGGCRKRRSCSVSKTVAHSFVCQLHTLSCASL